MGFFMGKKVHFFGLVGVLTLILAGGVWLWRSQSLSQKVDFELADWQGQKKSLTELKGKIVVLHFWAAWCEPCVEELPVLLKVAQKMTSLYPSDLRFVLVSLDQRWEDSLKILKNPEKLPPEVWALIDPKSHVPESLGSYQYPETYLLDRELNVMTKWVGPQKWESAAFEELMNRLMKKK